MEASRAGNPGQGRAACAVGRSQSSATLLTRRSAAADPPGDLIEAIAEERDDKARGHYTTARTEILLFIGLAVVLGFGVAFLDRARDHSQRPRRSRPAGHTARRGHRGAA